MDIPLYIWISLGRSRHGYIYVLSYTRGCCVQHKQTRRTRYHGLIPPSTGQFLWQGRYRRYRHRRPYKIPMGKFASITVVPIRLRNPRAKWLTIPRSQWGLLAGIIAGVISEGFNRSVFCDFGRLIETSLSKSPLDMSPGSWNWLGCVRTGYCSWRAVTNFWLFLLQYKVQCTSISHGVRFSTCMCAVL